MSTSAMWLSGRSPRLLAFLLLPVLVAGQSNIRVTGMGFFDNVELDQRLSFLNGVPNNEPQVLDGLAVEDDAYILLQLLARRGYPEAEVVAEWIQENGDRSEITWTLPFAPKITPEAAVSPVEEVTFVCRPGQLRYYAEVEVRGLTAIPPAEARDYFIPRGILFSRREDRAHTDEILQNRAGNLIGTLRRMGYREASIAHQEVSVDPQTGATRVQLVIDEGPLHRPGTLRLEGGRDIPFKLDLPDAEALPDVVNSGYMREVRQSVLNQLYRAGYPDARVEVDPFPRPADPGEPVAVDTVVRVNPGEFVELAGFSFEPPGLMKESVLRRQSRLGGLEAYDLVVVDEARRRLLALGVFQRVELREEAVGPGSRKAVYLLEPMPWQRLSLRLGYGSYEQIRAGLTWEHRNPFGRGHRYEIELRQSLKASRLTASYMVPHFFDQRNTGFIRAGHEARDEITYEHSSSEFLFGVTRRLRFPGAELSLEYAFEDLDTTRASTGRFASANESTVSSLSLAAVLGRRDSVLYPTRGFDLSVRGKFALEALGGESLFQKIELSGTYHRILFGSLYLHLGLRYGTLFSEKPTSRFLPFGERFFPGGPGTVRGYRRGEASPLTPEGDLVGAEGFVLANVELEQRILKNLSLVVFWDGIGISRERLDWPDTEQLYSIGLGIRWRSVVGPVRLEYGYNPEPRIHDPDGTLHLSVGFPF
jgi:outer membrane protein assembly factor BamA